MKHDLSFNLFDDFNRFLFNPHFTSDYVEEDSKVYKLSMDLPGISKEDLAVEFNQGVLTVKGENKTKNRKYSKTFKIPNTVDSESIEADLKDGILTLTLPKSVEKQTKLIRIK